MTESTDETVTEETAAEAPTEAVQPEAEDTTPDEGDRDDADLPEWAKAKIRKANNEAKNLRERLKAQEPLVTAAQEAERAQMSELERERADKAALQAQLAQRDTELLATRYSIPDDFIEFIGEGTFEEKEARAAKVGEMTRQKTDPAPVERPPSDRPVESLTPGASPSKPPAVDNSYPASWGFQPPSD